MLARIGLLAADTSRTRAYLDALARHDLLPGHVVFLAGSEVSGGGAASVGPVPYFDNVTPVVRRLAQLQLPCDTITATDPNDAAVVDAVRRSPVDVFVYSGPGGALLRHELLTSGKRFLHVHPGLLPAFRGSTTVYYSLLMTGRCGATAIFLDAAVDGGPMLAQRDYDPPADRSTLDHGYDPFIRADLLVRVLRDYAATGRFIAQPQPAGHERTYYVMHPVLRHAVILSQFGGATGV
jgi:methionyl-tRNA formyltransferase